MAFVRLEMSVPKIRLMEEVRLAGWALAGTPVLGAVVALSILSVALLNEFLLITITFEFSLFPFLRSYNMNEIGG